MCDQDHFEDDREQFEALGLVTRKQFGIMLGAGMAMMLPQVANAAAVTESEVTVTTPDGSADWPARLELSASASVADATMQTIATNARIVRVDIRQMAR